MMIKFTGLVAATLLLSACQTASSLQGSTANGAMGAVSCDQIYSSYAAYKVDRQSLGLLAQVSGLTETQISQATPAKANQYFENVVLSANVALAVQGCPPLQR